MFAATMQQEDEERRRRRKSPLFELGERLVYRFRNAGLCINMANETLQQHFSQHVFKMEQDEYTKGAINWSYIKFIDCQDVLDLIEEKPSGIIALIDEACMFPKSTNETFATKLFQQAGEEPLASTFHVRQVSLFEEMEDQIVNIICEQLKPNSSSK